MSYVINEKILENLMKIPEETIVPLKSKEVKELLNGYNVFDLIQKYKLTVVPQIQLKENLNNTQKEVIKKLKENNIDKLDKISIGELLINENIKNVQDYFEEVWLVILNVKDKDVHNISKINKSLQEAVVEVMNEYFYFYQHNKKEENKKDNKTSKLKFV